MVVAYLELVPTLLMTVAAAAAVEVAGAVLLTLLEATSEACSLGGR